MKTTKTIIKIALSYSFWKKLLQMAKQQYQAVPKILRELFRRYRALKTLNRVCREAQKKVKEKGLTPADFGGPFEE